MRWWYYPTLMEKLSVLMLRDEEVAKHLVPDVRDPVCDLFYMEGNME